MNDNIQENPESAGTKLRSQAEILLLKKAGSDKYEDMSAIEIERVIHELQVHQIELEMQNEALRVAQEEREVAQDRFVKLYNEVPVGYFNLNEQNIIQESNATAGTMLGLPSGFLNKKPFTRFIFPDDQDIFYIFRIKLLEDGVIRNCELRMLREDKSIFWVLVNASTVIDRKVKATLISISDISERKLLEQQNVVTAKNISKLNAEKKYVLESASRFKSDFIANMSHEIRTPLAIIRGYSELLADKDGDLENQTWIKTILASSQQLELLINDILDLSKIEAGKIEVELKSVALSQIISDVKNLLSLKVFEKGIHLKFAVLGTVPSTIMTDPLRLKQILLNVIGNAIKFTDRGGVDVVLSYKDKGDETSNSVLEFSVTDTGIGMTLDQQKKIFGAFSQADSTITRRFGGTGLGLSLSLNLARVLGGNIVVMESEIGKGSTFTVTINPGSIENVAMLQGPAAFEGEVIAAIEKDTAVGSIKGMKILLVEDAEDIRALVNHILVSQRAIVSVASNGMEGIQLSHKSDFDLILMDLQMPVLDGVQAVEQLRSEGCKLPIFAMTAHAMNGERERCISKGFTDYLSKPINFKKLSAMASKYRRPMEPSENSVGLH